MPTITRLPLAALLFASTTAIAQLPIPSSNPKVRAALDILRTDNAWTLQQQVELTAIPSPPFKESKRAAEFSLKNIRVDTAGNVIAERRGVGNGPTVVIAGHLDTVFPEGTDVTVKHDGTKLRAPGIGDDDRGLAAVLAVVRAFEKAGVQTNGTVSSATSAKNGRGSCSDRFLIPDCQDPRQERSYGDVSAGCRDSPAVQG